MSEYQLGRTLSNKEVDEIVVFLRTLTGQLPTDYINEPAPPPSTWATPKPDLR
jgi:cytochrome c peroxidase